MGFVRTVLVCHSSSFKLSHFLGTKADGRTSATGLADDNLFSSMVITPMSTLISAIQEFTTNTSLTGVTAEISGQKFTIRQPPEFVDDITKKNFHAFWALGYA
jgi:hypothetical protein